MIKIEKYHRIRLDQFHSSARTNLDEISKAKKKPIKSILKVVAKKSPDYDDSFDIRTSPISTLPTTLYSLKDLKKKYKFEHNVEVYRYLQSIGTPKLQINSLIRYSESDLIVPVVLAVSNKMDLDNLIQWINEQFM